MRRDLRLRIELGLHDQRTCTFDLRCGVEKNVIGDRELRRRISKSDVGLDGRRGASTGGSAQRDLRALQNLEKVRRKDFERALDRRRACLSLQKANRQRRVGGDDDLVRLAQKQTGGGDQRLRRQLQRAGGLRQQQQSLRLDLNRRVDGQFRREIKRLLRDDVRLQQQVARQLQLSVRDFNLCVRLKLSKNNRLKNVRCQVPNETFVVTYHCNSFGRLQVCSLDLQFCHVNLTKRRLDTGLIDAGQTRQRSDLGFEVVEVNTGTNGQTARRDASRETTDLMRNK